mgnify:CR=1 FL=1
MIWKNALKYPMLIIGIVLFIIFLNSPTTKDYWRKHTQRFTPNACTAIESRISKKMPSNWNIECPGTVRLILNVEFNKTAKSQGAIRTLVYRELANTYMLLANISNPETMENIQVIEVKLKHKSLEVHSKSDGQAVVELKGKKTQKDIANHLKLTVTTKEI